MENPCKKHIDEKVYSYQPAESKEKCKKPDVSQIDCKKKEAGFGGLFGKDAKVQSDILEMAPPPYADLGKRARDVFGKGYHFGLIKLDCKTTTASGIQFNTGGVSDQESGKVSGTLESKYTIKDYGITFTEKWATNNTLGTEASIKDQGLKGLTVTGGINFSPQDGYQSGVIKLAYGNERVALNADADLNSDNQIIKGSAVVGHQGWLAGYQGAFDVQNSKLAKSNFALGFSTKDCVLHTQVSKGDDEGGEGSGQIFSASIYQKISERFQNAIDILWYPGGGGPTTYGLGCSYELDVDATIRAKIDNMSQLGLSYSQRLRDGLFEAKIKWFIEQMTVMGRLTIVHVSRKDSNKPIKISTTAVKPIKSRPTTVNLPKQCNRVGEVLASNIVDDGQVFGGSICQQINPNLETAINLSWATSGEKTVFGLGCKYNLDQDASIRAKINNSSQIGLGYQQRLRDGVTLTLSTLIDGRNFNQGGHKIGLALELEA